MAPPPGAAPATTPADRKLRDAAQQLEALFMNELFKAMRATVPQGEGIVSGGTGEEMFTAQFDQHVADSASATWQGGISDALYRQLRDRIAPLPSPDAPSR
ncbi:MAG: rod-binding protein [Gemmatimonadetes bacterium]|nr:rod-binding protein [Gemmatimonadota bacterium]